MYIKETRGITLIALAITIILLLILGGVTISQLNGGNIFDNAISVAEKSKIASKKEEIQLAITRKMIETDGDITIEDIISKLEKSGIIDSGNSNSENGQVKTKQDGYVYEIVQDANGNWNVNYVGKGEIEAIKITLATSVDTTSITNKVIITATATAKSGIKSIQLPDGSSKTYARGTTTATITYEVTQNGTYKFTATNNNNENIDKTVAISNILEGEIAITINPSTPTNKDVTATITWPSGNYSAIKEVSTNGGTTYTTCTGTTTQINIVANCNIRARIKTASGEIKTQTYEVTNIDKTNPTVTAKQSTVTISEGDSNELSNYFNIEANGKYGISSIVYTDTSNNNIIVTNTNTLTEGTHTIKCTVTKETEAIASDSVTVVVEGNKAKITFVGSEWEKSSVNVPYDSILTIRDGYGHLSVTLNGEEVNALNGNNDSENVCTVKVSGGATISGGDSTTRTQIGAYSGISSITVTISDDATIDAYAWYTCVPYYAPINTPNGDIKAEDIKVGDIVYGYDFESNKIVETKVLKIGQPIRHELVKVYSENGDVLEFTPNHAVYTDKGWCAYAPKECLEIEAGQLEVGQKILSIDGNYYTITNITLDIIKDTQFYDFTTETSNFFTNNTLVHNARCIGNEVIF